ncbi:DUF6368 family protein [Actinoplanes missouriensis]|uniref:DUF6368 family protein n=1 Tax=Actinoplanes missouriensis TaxID=1866 RepID=UPI0033C2AF79
MAGPSAVVLLPDVWTSQEEGEFRVWLAESFRPDGHDWWVLRDPRPLGLPEHLQTGPMLIEVGRHEADDAGEAAGLARAAGSVPGSEIVLAAAVNGTDDHRLLAEIAVAIARRYGGLIGLDGPLPVPTGSATAREIIRSLRGRWHEIPYRTAGGDVAVYHVVDAGLLSSWLRHPHFRMVK